MAKKRSDYFEKNEDASFELELAPMLALMVTLIPMMLLATSFLKVGVIETPLPQAVQAALEEDRKKKEREVTLYLDMFADKSFVLDTVIDGRSKKQKISPSGGEFNFGRLHDLLVKAKQVHPKVFNLNLKPAQGVPYSEIVKVMDEARTIKDKNKKVLIKDTKTQEESLTDVMFPDVIFANVVEG